MDVTVVDPPGPRIEYNAYKLGATAFEELCCALLRIDPLIDNADLYGRPRQTQYGVDVLGIRRDGRGVHVISCKCYSDVAKDQIGEFANDFLRHWLSHWKAKRVRRFILAVPADLRSLERRAEIDAAARLLKKIGVRFDVWHKRELTHQIRANPDIRREFFGEWSATSQPAGTQPVSASRPLPTTAPLSATVISQIQDLQTALQGSISSQVDQVIDSWRRGTKVNIAAVLGKLRKNKNRWNSLTPTVQVRVLRTQALHALSQNSLSATDRLLKEAERLEPGGGRRILALLAFRRYGPERGLETLGAPSTKEEALVHAGLLLENNQPEDAVSALRRRQSKAKNDPEWRRLMACATFANGKRSVGLEHIREAEKLAPDWTSVLRTGAILRYGTALSPAADFHITRLPPPVHPDLVLRDENSQALLTEALARLELLSTKQLSIEERDEIDVWRLATLANLTGREKQARSLCRSQVTRRQMSTAAVFWGIARGYLQDREGVVRRLERKLRRKARTVDHLQALLACLFSIGKTRNAQEALTRYGSRFKDASSKQVVAAWRTRLAIRSEKTLPAMATAEPFTVLDRLLSEARTSKNWISIEPFLASIGHQADVVFAASQALAAAGQWLLVRPHAELLVDRVATAEATRLAVYTWYNTEAFEAAVRTIDEYPERFPGGALPEDLSRLKVYATARLGDIREARALAGNLARDSGKVADQLFAAQVHIRGGDVSGALPFVRDALGQHAGAPGQLLQFVPSVFTEDPTLARELVQKAVARGLRPREGAFALKWAYKLGLREEAGRLLAELSAHTDGTEPVLRTASLDEVIEHMRTQQEAAAALNLRYRRGEGPIHAIAGATSTNLARIWRDAFESGDAGPILLVRHGNRSTNFFAGQYPADVTLALDVTALLTQEWLGLLDALEASDIKLALPPSLMTVLEHLEEDAHHHQPLRMATVQKVVDYVEAHPVCLIASSTLNDTDPTSGRVVFDLPADGSPAMRRLALGSAGTELVRRGGVSKEDFARIQLRFAGWQSSAAELDIQAIRTLAFEHNTIDVVVDAGLLDAFTKTFEVRVDVEHYERCLAERRDFREREAVAERLRVLRRRLAQSIERGRYVLLTQAASESGRPTALTHRDILIQPLFELLASRSIDAHWIWIDDRYCTGFVNSHGNIIVSVYEVLRYLNDTGKLAPAQLYESLARLRRARVGFLPVTAEEVVYNLRQAQLENDSVVETPELAALRRSLNQLLLREEDLDLDVAGAPGERIHELHSLLVALGCGRDCLEAIWRDRNIPLDTRIAWSDWIWEALRVERLTRVPVGGDGDAKRRLWCLMIAQLLVLAISIPVLRDGDIPDGFRRTYLRWLEFRVLDIGEHGNPGMRAHISATLTTSLTDLLKSLQEGGPDERVSLKDARPTLLRFTEALPDELRADLYRDPYIQDALQPNVVTVVNFDQLRFAAKDFWDKLAQAWNGDAQSVASVDGQQFQVQREAGDFTFTGNASWRFADPALEMLSSDESVRRAFVSRKLPQLVDATDDVEAVVQQLASSTSPFERMKFERELRARTAVGRYTHAKELFASKEELSANELLPACVDRYLAFLGLSADGDTRIDWEATATQLAAHVGPEETLRRLAGIPIRLPAVVLENFRRMDLPAATALVEGLRRDSITTLRRLRVIELLRGDARPTWDDTIEKLATDLLSTWQSEARALHEVLHWSERVWRRDPRWRALPVGHRLACVWAHADHTLAIFSASQFNSKLIEERMATLHSGAMRDVLVFDSDYESNIAAPRRLLMETLLLYGLNAALGTKAGSLLQKHRAAYVSLVTYPLEPGPFPMAGLFADRRHGRDELGAYLSDELDPWFAEPIDAAGIALLTESGREEMLSQAIGLLQTQPENPSAWMQIVMVGSWWLPSELRRTVDEALERFKFALVSENDGQIARVLTALVPFSGVDSRHALERELIRWTDTLSKRHATAIVTGNTDSLTDQDALAVLELAFALARRKDLRQALEQLNRIVKDVVMAWPALAARCRDLLSHTLRECSSAEGEELWSTFVLLRALR